MILSSVKSFELNSVMRILNFGLKRGCSLMILSRNPYITMQNMNHHGRTHYRFVHSSSPSSLISLVSSNHRLSNIELTSSRNFRGLATSSQKSESNSDMLKYLTAVIISFIGLSYAAVPLYKMFCQATGYAGTPKIGHKLPDGNPNLSPPEKMVPLHEKKPIRIYFNADVGQQINWKFTPQQKEIMVQPGETALAFYTAENKSDEEVTGIATYNVNPMGAAQYFNKIQCFCFEYQRLKPHEKVDMPIFFYIDPEFVNDPLMRNVDMITLSYTFFAAKNAHKIRNALPIEELQPQSSQL